MGTVLRGEGSTESIVVYSWSPPLRLLVEDKGRDPLFTCAVSVVVLVGFVSMVSKSILSLLKHPSPSQTPPHHTDTDIPRERGSTLW